MSTSSSINEADRWRAISTILSRPSSFGNETGKLPNGFFEPSLELFHKLRFNTKILVIGAGGLGCEILKDLALSGFTNIHVIDLDTIDISNLNRQFLFRKSDVGRSKAEVAAEFIMKRVSGCHVSSYVGRIQDRDSDFYSQFNLILCGLDNVEARRWLNSFVVSLARFDSDGDLMPESIIPIIDGGTEGFKGQARVILPRVTSCFECSIALFPPQVNFPMCTIAETPRIPEHCIAYAYMMEWDRHFPDKKLNKDSPEDMQWVYEKALQRSQLFGIDGVTYFKTIGVVKNIIPAVASTNATISAACVNEAIKLISFCSQTMNNYYLYLGSESVYTPTMEYARQDNCIVCGNHSIPRPILLAGTTTLRALIAQLCEDAQLQLKKPSIVGIGKTLYMQNPPVLEEMTRENLDQPLSSLILSGEILNVSDAMLNGCTISIQVELFE